MQQQLKTHGSLLKKDLQNKLQILSVPSTFIFEVISFVKEIAHLIQAHQHRPTYLTRNRNINPSRQHSSKVFKSKQYYAGHNFSKLPIHINEKKFWVSSISCCGWMLLRGSQLLNIATLTSPVPKHSSQLIGQGWKTRHWQWQHL